MPSKSLVIVGAMLVAGLVGSACARSADAATVQVRNNTALPLRIYLQGTNSRQYVLDTLQPGTARVYKVQSDSQWVALFILPPGGRSWINMRWLRDPKAYSIRGYHYTQVFVAGDIDPRFR